MPIYEYQCEKCQHEFEREQRITADPIKTCPKCKARRVKKLISQTSFVLKGGGWYNDLYSSSKKDDPASSTDAKSEAKSDGKKSDGDSKSDKSKKSADKGTKASDKSSKGKSSKSAA
ncbi:MAG: zinc ribbon domain-containing protein [Deltaproteobacteria bacterium]|nr:zinc ribbon domain-containing protein [Deltaproteobacteria bacterium]MBW2723820.1 zinc ribbon domain-containing protein [Deltaproteobacteria bacterium]